MGIKVGGIPPQKKQVTVNKITASYYLLELTNLIKQFKNKIKLKMIFFRGSCRIIMIRL